MRTWRATWGAAVTLTALLALGPGVATVGWMAMLAASGMLALVGALLGLAWVTREDPWRPVRAGAIGFGLYGLLLLGLPAAIGGWTLIVIALLVVTSPAIMLRAMRVYRRRRPMPTTVHPERLSDHELASRWRRTSDELRLPAAAPAAVLRVVQEREVLLAEMERRNPELFAHMLVRAGWRDADSAADW